jgi:hypothetical protein
MYPHQNGGVCLFVCRVSVELVWSPSLQPARCEGERNKKETTKMCCASIEKSGVLLPVCTCQWLTQHQGCQMDPYKQLKELA